MNDKRRMTGRGPGFGGEPGQPFAGRGSDAVYRLRREGTPLELELRISMSGSEYSNVSINGIGTDGLPIQMSYRDHADGKIGVSTFKHIRNSDGTTWERLHDTRPAQLQGDMA